ncbi:bacterial alpha-L-rhamnosidase-domain-containing protein [Flammula alnicola]|nr:bacterial alpha-L-rhamnosidase-domain-containing protein [Flammula alnicola]
MQDYLLFFLLLAAAKTCICSAASIDKFLASETITLSSLLVEDKVAPIGIDVTPRFSWIISSPQNGDVQASYHLQVSKVKAGNAEVWNSAVVSSKRSYLIEYGGPPLESDTRYFWSVQVVTTFGSSTASSEFTTGFLSTGDWGPGVWIGKPTQGPPPDLISAFQGASWIWTSESSPPNAPPGDVAFRKTLSTPSGKTATSADILITADDQFSMYVDGNPMGSSPQTANIWMQAQFLNLTLNTANSTLFAVRVTNLPDVSTGGNGPAGLLVAIKITFSDGTATIITSDPSWILTTNITDGWNLPSGSVAGWTAASAIAPYGQGPWGTQVTVPAAASTPQLSFANSFWIWSTETNPPLAPAAPRAFRKTFSATSGKTLLSALIILTVDDAFSFYADGIRLGSSPEETDTWEYAQTFTATLHGTSAVFAVLANNLPDVSTGGASPAGLLASIQITYTDGSSDFVVSDTTWKVDTTVPVGFENPSFDDSSWSLASSQGPYGVGPWENGVTIVNSLEEHPAPLIRKEFGVSKPLSFARLYYSAGGYASITINGAPASDHVLTPGFTKYDTEIQYIALDVASLLKSGTNAIGAELGRSHYGSTQGSVWNWNTVSWHGEPRVIMVLSLGFVDGSTSRVVTDGTWKVKEGPTRLDDVFGGENYDAAFEQQGFDTAGFNDSSWSAAAIMPAPGGTLVNQGQPPTRIIQSLTPVSIKEPVSGIFVAEFERVVSGWVRLTASGPAKTQITIHFGEKLHDDGTVMYEDFMHYYANNFQTDRFWLAGTGQPETFEPKFSYKGYLYVQIEGWPGSSPPSVQDIVGRVVHDDLAPRGNFMTSSDLLNQLHTAANGWTGDAMLSTETALFNLDSQGLLTKYVEDLDKTRLDSSGGAGPPSVIAPDSGWGANNQAPTWHSAFIFIPWWIYFYKGDQRVLENHYDSMKSYIEFELGRSPNNIANTGLGDWDTPETNPNGGNPPEDPRVSATAYLYQMLTVMENIATVLNKTSDASTFSTQAANVKMAFNSAFLSSTTGYYVGVGDQGYRQTHNLLALGFSLAPTASIQHVADSIAQNISSIGNHLNTGALGTKLLLPVLSENGHADTAFAVAQQTTFPSWGFWIENGATTMWEHWSIDARSRDHHFLGTFEDWMFKHVAGIQPTSAAFETVNISPLLTSQLTFTRAWTMTPFGNLSVEWTDEAGAINVDLGVPVGVNVTFSIPGITSSVMNFESGSHSFSIPKS